MGAPWWRLHFGLRRRLFTWFGVAIAASAAAAAGMYHVSGGHVRFGMFAATAVILWIASGAIAWRLTRPLFQVIRVARAIGDGKIGTRLDLGRHDGELGVLADSINDMAARIEQQLADQRELLAAVSHEIRTPLGHMRILLDTARDRKTDAALVDDLEREVLEVDRLVAQLLAGSRLDFDAVDRRELDAAAVAALALERAGIDAARLDVAADDTRLTGDPTLLARALANLIDNAARHAGGATRLRVRAGTGDDDGALVFEVEDGGPGFADAELGRVFESFYRGERRGAGSLGIGLALVRRIAVAHGGRAFAENAAGGGARVGFTVARG
jgi:signal transduction histidine kinase